MVAYREPDGLERTARVLVSLEQEVRSERHRHSVERFHLIFFGAIFVLLLAGETLFASMMFALIQIEILGTVFSGAAFALLVPTVIGAAHIKLHHEGDHFTRWWLKKLSSIGILVFALGVSLMVGFSAWQAAQDAVSAISSAPTGTIGGHNVGGDADASSGIAGWIAIIPNSLLFIGLSFGMIITISVASFCLGRALQAFNVLTLTPRIGDEAKGLIEQLSGKIAEFRKLRDADATERRKLPFDPKSKFARAAAHAAWKVAQVKLAAARGKFSRFSDPVRDILGDPTAEAIPESFASEEEFARHLADQMDIMRLHNLLRVLTGIPETGKDEA